MKTKFIFWMTVVSVMAIIVLAGTGCQSQQAAASQVADITVVTSEFKFNPGTITVRMGQRVRVTLDNTKGTLKHDFHQPDLSLHAEVDAGKKTVFEFTPTKAGTFDLTCDVPGHKDAGMAGKLIVQP